MEKGFGRNSMELRADKFAPRFVLATTFNGELSYLIDAKITSYYRIFTVVRSKLERRRLCGR